MPTRSVRSTCWMLPDANALFASDIVRADGIFDRLDHRPARNAAITDLNSEWALALPSYSDQVLPFNVTLAGANEYGAMCAAKILGIEILNEGSGISRRRRRHRVPGHLRRPCHRAPAGGGLAVRPGLSLSPDHTSPRARARPSPHRRFSGS